MKSLILLTFLASSIAFAETKTISVEGMTCAGCVANVEKSVCKGLNYTEANCKVEIGKLTVTADKVDVAAIEAALKKDGYEIAGNGATPTHGKTCTGDAKTCHGGHSGDHAAVTESGKPAKTSKKK